MEINEQLEMIRKYGNKNSCYTPFIGGGTLSDRLRRICQNRIHEDLSNFGCKRLQRTQMCDCGE